MTGKVTVRIGKKIDVSQVNGQKIAKGFPTPSGDADVHGQAQGDPGPNATLCLCPLCGGVQYCYLVYDSYSAFLCLYCSQPVICQR